MFAGTTWAEVIPHSIECRKRHGAIGPYVSPVSFILGWRKHLHWRFIGMDLAQARTA